MSCIVIIPARMGSSRLPGKPLADIAGKPMIVHVWERAVAAGIGPVVVAAAEREIAVTVEKSGGTAVLTDPALASGTDRVFAALRLFDPEGSHSAVVNLQGDLPLIEPANLETAERTLRATGADIATLAAPISDEADFDNPSVVKPVIAWDRGMSCGRALYFTRSRAPYGEGALYHHIGIYAFRRDALQRFVALPPSPLERRENLEQLRALEAGMTVAVARVETVPLSVDTPADLARVRAAAQPQMSSG
ncbi:MAG TPA: 3-deoxy-manno-octulosonate cytidylyltransferase [Rhizomicrobium sp.]|jgi:3-deoxy-manno-octulosonate cytidylyltransferase (CMP-KDO synthetase)